MRVEVTCWMGLGGIVGGFEGRRVLTGLDGDRERSRRL